MRNIKPGNFRVIHFIPVILSIEQPTWNGPEEFTDQNNWVDLYQFEDSMA